MRWERGCFQRQVCWKDEKKRKKITYKVQLVTNRVSPLSIIHYLFCLTFARWDRNEERLIILHCVSEGENRKGAKKVGGQREWAAGNARPQPCPPPDLSPSPFCRAIKGKTIFSYCFIKHYVGLFIAFSPDSYSIPAAAVCTSPGWTEKAHWSSIRWNMELSESVPPTSTYTQTLHAAECACLLEKWRNLILSNVLYCLSIHESVVSCYNKCVSVPTVCVSMCNCISYSTT